MNNKKISKFAIRRAKETKLGRFLCRLAGEESGQAMMEYVIIAVLIAAAVAVGAWYFGRSVNNEFRVASHAVTGDDTTAQTAQSQAQGAVAGQDDAARTAQKAYIQTADEDAADIDTTPKKQ